MTADSLRKQLRLYVEGKRGNSHRVCAPQWGAEQHNGMFPHPHPDLPIQNQCIAKPGGYWSPHGPRTSGARNGRRGAAASTKNYRDRDAPDGFRCVREVFGPGAARGAKREVRKWPGCYFYTKCAERAEAGERCREGWDPGGAGKAPGRGFGGKIPLQTITRVGSKLADAERAGFTSKVHVCDRYTVRRRRGFRDTQGTVGWMSLCPFSLKSLLLSHLKPIFSTHHSTDKGCEWSPGRTCQ